MSFAGISRKNRTHVLVGSLNVGRVGNARNAGLRDAVEGMPRWMDGWMDAATKLTFTPEAGGVDLQGC